MNKTNSNGVNDMDYSKVSTPEKLSDLENLRQEIITFSENLDKTSKRLETLVTSLQAGEPDEVDVSKREMIPVTNKIQSLINDVNSLSNKLETINSNINYLEGILR